METLSYANSMEAIPETEKVKEKLPHGSRILILCDSCTQPENGCTNCTGKSRASLHNGPQTLLENISSRLSQQGYDIKVVTPDVFTNVPLPMYDQFHVPLYTPHQFRDQIGAFKPDSILVMTAQGVLGLSAAYYLHRKNIPYALIGTTNIQAYIDTYMANLTHGIASIPKPIIERFVRSIFARGSKIFVHTHEMQSKMAEMGLTQTILWPGAVDTELFRPLQEGEQSRYEEYSWQREDRKPILLYFGRVAEEKNLEAFLSMNTQGYHKVVIGDGPIRKDLEKKYPEAHFLGVMKGEELASHVRSADVMIFPSLSETWGLVATEASASGVPVVAYNVQGPAEGIIHGQTGILVEQGESLEKAVEQAMLLDKNNCAEVTASLFSWDKALDTLLRELPVIQPAVWERR